MNKDNWTMPVADEYEFDICVGCSLYPCEYIGEFTKFLKILPGPQIVIVWVEIMLKKYIFRKEMGRIKKLKKSMLQ